MRIKKSKEETAVSLRKKGAAAALGKKGGKKDASGKSAKPPKTVAKKGDKKGTNGKSKKSADIAQLVVVSKLKEAVRNQDLRIGGEFAEAFNKSVNNLLVDALNRCKANGRQTVKEFDAT